MNAPHPVHETGLILGGCFLAFCAAMINVHFLRVCGVSVSHLTGDLTRIPVEWASNLPGQGSSWLLVFIVAGFFGGACVAGAWYHGLRLAPGSHYAAGLFLIAVIFGGAGTLVGSWEKWAPVLAAVGCGFQNAMATHYRGLVLRTTHITGILTDLGQMVGMRLAGRQVEPWRFVLHTSIILSFMGGLFVGVAVGQRTPKDIPYMMSIAYACASLLLLVWHARNSTSTRRRST